MANSITTQVIVDGPRNVVLKIVGRLDTSNLASTTIADPALLAGIDISGTVKAAKVRIKSLQYNVESPLSVVLSWDATAAVVAAELDGVGELEGGCYGGIPNNSGAGRTGKLLLTTLGWTSGVASFTLIVELVKEQT